jgi:hypothetical protein
LYRNSDKKGFRRWWTSFKIAVVIGATVAGLIPNSADAMEPYETNNRPFIERASFVPHGNYSPYQKPLSGKNMCMSSTDENGFLMDYGTAYNLIKETYQGSLQITNEQNIDYWQACKKISHAIDFGINPEDYGIS